MTIKTGREIEAMRAAGAIVAGALALAGEMARPGVSTLAINDAIHKYITNHGAAPSFLHYNGFPASACISVNEQVVHGIPDKRTLVEGDIVSIDVGAVLNGYHGDAARTFGIGKISAQAQKLIEVTEACFWEGIAQAKAGNRIGDISYAIESLANEHGYGVVRELVGHGIGEEMHEPPDVPNYGKPGRGIRLQSGMTIAVEPMINAGTRNVFMLEDGWTVVTQDGSYSAHYENTIAITDNEPLVLTLP